MSQIIIVASGIQGVTIDGVKYVPEGATPPDPEVPPVDPNLPPPNQGAILPPLDPWNVEKHFIFPNGAIFGFAVPVLQGGGPGMAFTQGQDANSQGGCVTEFSVSQIPGVIIPGQGAYYYESEPSQLNNNMIVIYREGSKMPLAPSGQAWYVNVRWTNPTGAPNGFSLQWAPAA